MTLKTRNIRRRSQGIEAIDNRQTDIDPSRPWPWHTQVHLSKDPSKDRCVANSNRSDLQDSFRIRQFGNMFDLKMRTFQKNLLSEHEVIGLADRIDAMKQKEETSYKCRDYLHRRSLRQKADGRSAKERKNDMSTFTTGCRRKMCEWSYHVIDFYRADRTIVANAFSVLDRFLDSCDCDRTVFKLASITSLYIASKSHSQRHLSLSTLAELSSGDFDENHFKRMEHIILDMIEWRVNSPTAGAFVDHLVCLVPMEDETITREISARAHFFAELSLLDYYFVPERASSIALASILNAMEGLQLPPRVSRSIREGFLRELEQVACMDYQYQKLSYDMMQERLWKLYRETEQCQVHDENPPMAVEDKGSQSDKITRRKTSTDASPVCVNMDNVDLTHTYSM